MKSKPKDNEPALIHFTENTGHLAKFGLNWENYDPRAIRVAADMLHDESKIVGGFYLTRPASLFPESNAFDIWVRTFDRLEYGISITANRVKVEERQITIATRILALAETCSEETMSNAADLEQCAAIAIAFELGRQDLFEDPKVVH